MLLSYTFIASLSLVISILCTFCQVRVFAPQMTTTTTAIRARIPAVKRVTRSERGESTLSVLLNMKCSKMAAKMLRLVLLKTQVNVERREEGGMTVHVKDFYTEARYLMERMAKIYYDFYGVRSIGFRFFSVYGPREEAKKDFANLISQFMWDLKAGRSPLIYGDGTQTRDFTFVDDINEGFRLGMKNEIDCDVFNLGTGDCYSLNELVDILNEILETDIKPVYKENPIQNYVEATLADTSKAKEHIDFEATISLRDGIKKIV